MDSVYDGKIRVVMDASQYRIDLLQLSVEKEMFVEEIYASCHLVVRVD